MQEKSPSGHIPLNEETLQKMTPNERAFWENFLYRVDRCVRNEVRAGASRPYRFPETLRELLSIAVKLYDGNQYCQVNQIREVFDCAGVGVPSK